MNLESKLKELRTSGEQSIVEQIESDHPADWDMEDAFEKSYQAYLQKNGTPVLIHRSRHQAVFRMVSAAACLILTVGLGVGVWSKQQKIETRPPQETSVTTFTQTQTRTETTMELTAAATTASQVSETGENEPGTTASAEMPAVHQETAQSAPIITETIRKTDTQPQTAQSTPLVTDTVRKTDTQLQTTTAAATASYAPVTAVTFPPESKEDMTMKTSTMQKLQTTITAAVTTAALITTQPLITTAEEPSTAVTIPGFVTQYGDVNLDAEVSMTDVVRLQRYLLGTTKKLKSVKNADLNNDNVVDIYDLAILKRGLVHDMEGIGGTMRVTLVDPATGKAPDTHAHVELTGALLEWDDSAEYFYDKEDFVLAEYDYTPGDVWEIRGLPTDSYHRYDLTISKLEGEYGDENGDWCHRCSFTFEEDKTDGEVTLEVTKERANVVIGEYDWSLRYEPFSYGHPIVTDQNGKKCEPTVYGWNEFRLPDGTYHAEWHFWAPRYGITFVDPDSDLAKEIMAADPDVVFTDQSNGIDFTVKDAKPDKELQFNFMSVDGFNNQLTVNCIDSETGKPIAGAELSLILDPNGKREIVDSWTSDETGSRHFENLKISGRPSYKVQVDKMPEGYSGILDTNGSTAYYSYGSYYETGNEEEITLEFVPDTMEKNVSFNIVKWEDKSLLNDLGTYEIVRWNGSNSEIVMGSVKAGEKFALPDGEYLAFLHGKEFLDTDYRTISINSVSGNKIFEEGGLNPDDYISNTAFVLFTVKDGKPDKDLVFYVKQHEPDDDADVPTEIDYDAILKYLYGIE